ncbi:MAG: FHA domain-containing protein, partial [bacterium]
MKIQILKDGKLLSEYDIIKDSFTLGRSDDCDITILEDGIARKHIEFKKSGKESFSFVKKSKFGVLSKNGEATDKGTISGGDRLEVGDVIIALSQSENTIDVTDAGTSGTEEVPIVEDQEIIEQIEDTSAGKKNKSKEKEKASKKANSDFEFFTMTGKPEDFGKQDEEQDQAKAQEKQKEEKQKSKIVKKGTVVKEAEEEAKKGESSTIYGQPIEIVSRPEVGDATTVGPALLLYQLIVISGPYKDKTFSLEKDAVIIGRAKNADIVLIDDLVSREHTRMYRQGVNYYLIDLNSSNGTKVNGKKAQEPIALTSGDIIEIGSSTLRFMVMNPQVQGAQGIDMGPEDAKGNRPVIEKVAPILTDGDIKKIEKSFGYEEDKAPKKKKLLP